MYFYIILTFSIIIVDIMDEQIITIIESIKTNDIVKLKSINLTNDIIINGEYDDYNYNNYTLLMIACQYDNLEIVKYIKQFYSDITAYDGYDDEQISAFMYACMSGHLNIVMYFVEELKIDINLLNYKQQSALLFALEYNHSNIVRYLIQQGADTKVLGKYNRTILHVAASINNFDLVQYFHEELGFELEIKDNNDATVIFPATCIAPPGITRRVTPPRWYSPTYWRDES
jgi:ankyrin repeat protein